MRKNGTTETTFYVYRDGVDGMEDEIELTIRGCVDPYDPGICSGPVERCYPPSGGGAEIDEVLLDGRPWSGELTEEERKDVESALVQQAEEDDEADADAAADSAFDFHREGD